MTFKDFICPFTKSNLKLNNKKKFLINKSNNKFYFKNNLVNFLKLRFDSSALQKRAFINCRIYLARS